MQIWALKNSVIKKQNIFCWIQTWYTQIPLWVWNKIFFPNYFFSWVVLFLLLVVCLLWHCSIWVLFFRPESSFHTWPASSSSFHMSSSLRAPWPCLIKREAFVRIVWLSLSIPWPFHYSFPSIMARKTARPATQGS